VPARISSGDSHDPTLRRVETMLGYVVLAVYNGFHWSRTVVEVDPFHTIVVESRGNSTVVVAAAKAKLPEKPKVVAAATQTQKQNQNTPRVFWSLAFGSARTLASFL